MDNLTAQQLIDASILFRGLQPHEATAVIARLQAVSFPQDTQVVKYGEWHGQFYIIASGSVRVLLQESKEARAHITVARLGHGECFGEMSLLTGEAATATVSTEEDTTLWSLSQSDFLMLIGACPTLSRNINHILSLRLARMNQHILTTRTAERIWLALIDQPTEPMERTLTLHIAHALAQRSRKRVLLLEFCDFDEASGPHFATQAGQLRPDLLACIHDHTLFEQHKAPTVTDAGQHFAALTTLTHKELGKQEQTSHTSSWHERALQSLIDLANLYDYLLIVTTETTPAYQIRIAAELSQRTMVLISAFDGNMRRTQLAASAAYMTLAKPSNTPRSLFIAHAPEPPTIGVLDRYNALLGFGHAKAPFAGQQLTRVLPADKPLLAQCWQQQQTLQEGQPDAELTKAVDFVARHIARQTVGVAFGGGAARGFAHVGVLQHLLENNIPLDYMSSCSIGVIVPGMYAMGRSLEEIERVFLAVQSRIVQWTVPYTSIFSGKGLKQIFREVCGPTRFEDLSIPMAAVAVDLGTRMGVVMDRGPLWKAGLASVALPGIFPPVVIGKHILMDAGMHDPVPVSAIRAMGADILVAVELSDQPLNVNVSSRSWFAEAQSDHPKSWFHAPHIGDVLLRSYDIAMATVSLYSVREADVIVRPQLHSVSLRQFSGGHKFIEAGYAAVEEALPALQQRLPWLA